MQDVFLPGNGFDTYEVQDKVLIGMSGGVDSSVAVRILQQQGFAVTGAVIRFSPAHESAVEAARRAAEQLGIQCIVLDAQDLFEREVITPFCADYCAGRTPNPCVLCNPAVKFASLLEAAGRLGIPYIATGHYARVEVDGDGVSRIHQPASAARDQSYMLCRLPQAVLSRLILPLGEFEKEDIRAMAREFGLDCADAPDSMEICFIPEGDYAGYIARRGLTGKAGRFLSPDGADLGPHKGVLHYTIGQRKGLGLALGEPVFIKTILENGDIQLARAGQEYFRTVTLRDLSTADGKPLPAGRYEVKIRSAARLAPALFDGRNTLTFEEPVRAPAPGQTAAFYREGAVLGGGFITGAAE
ncbi:MAG: tRNA 2-thiouridine(34) synthase MnmA [Candidatus Faecalibacterium intestinavium]|uniref:tRNA-uridine 2-sulfurtransferase n=1 Tax=Candidatus Faecalibacterium intestinavium TaxID=2838580 RepID=A0A9E2KKS4_9FIRM|nr:tRNA 2-thiouridine(34) synthase MnmA [Candidatus Faecalibacterium intestinavium]